MSLQKIKDFSDNDIAAFWNIKGQSYEPKIN